MARSGARGLRWGAAAALAVLLVAGVATILGAGRSAAPAQPAPAVVAAVPYFDLDAALASAGAHPGVIDVVTPWWFGVAPDGSISSDLPPGVDPGPRLAATGALVVPTVASTFGGQWAPQNVQRVLHDDAARTAHVRALAALASAPAYAGLQIDYEDLGPADRDVFSRFLADLAAALHAENRQLYVTVHPKTDDAGYDNRNLAQDYAAIGQAADRVNVMAYDLHWRTSPPGPVAPLPWVEDVVRYAASQIPPQKLLLGVPLYGYDWPAGGPGVPVVWQQVQDTAQAAGATPAWDAASSSSQLVYQRNGVTHTVWFEGARSVAARVDLATRYGLAGVALWRLGGEDPGIWAELPGPPR